jgi:hypothetical protein
MNTYNTNTLLILNQLNFKRINNCLPVVKTRPTQTNTENKMLRFDMFRYTVVIQSSVRHFLY